MESFSLMFFMEIGLIVLLIAALIYMFLINKKLKLLRTGGDGFRAVVVELNHATDNAQNAIQGLKLTVRDAEHGLDGNLKQARSVTEELKYLIEQASIQSNGIAGTMVAKSPMTSPQPVAQNRAKNFADQALEKVIAQRQSLPNPILHANKAKPENLYSNPNIGRNLDSEHKEMALQRRDEMLKTIADKQRGQQIMPGSYEYDAQQANEIDTTEVPTNENPLTSSMGRAIENQIRHDDQGGQNRQTINNGQIKQGSQSTLSGRLARQNIREPIHSKYQSRNNNITGSPSQKPIKNEMSLSDMVGRHAELERQEFTKNAQTSEQAQSQNRPMVSDDARNKNKNLAKNKSLFQKLSKTR